MMPCAKVGGWLCWWNGGRPATWRRGGAAAGGRRRTGMISCGIYWRLARAAGSCAVLFLQRGRKLIESGVKTEIFLWAKRYWPRGSS